MQPSQISVVDLDCMSFEQSESRLKFRPKRLLAVGSQKPAKGRSPRVGYYSSCY